MRLGVLKFIGALKRIAFVEIYLIDRGATKNEIVHRKMHRKKKKIVMILDKIEKKTNRNRNKREYCMLRVNHISEF